MDTKIGRAKCKSVGSLGRDANITVGETYTFVAVHGPYLVIVCDDMKVRSLIDTLFEEVKLWKPSFDN